MFKEVAPWERELINSDKGINRLLKKRKSTKKRESMPLADKTIIMKDEIQMR